MLILFPQNVTLSGLTNQWKYCNFTPAIMLNFTRRALLSVVSIFCCSEHSSFFFPFLSALATVTDNFVPCVLFGTGHRFSRESLKLVSAMSCEEIK